MTEQPSPDGTAPDQPARRTTYTVGIAEPVTGEGVRRMVSFARVDQRLQDKDARAIERYGDRWLLDLPRSTNRSDVHPDARLDPVAVFGRRAPLVVEVGAGSGDATTAGGEQLPDHDLLSLEVYRPGLYDMLRKVGSRDLRNVRLLEADAVPVFETLLPAGSVREVWTFFPDPWPKTRHHKRRIVQPAFATLVARVLEPGGVWRLATDWPDYAAWMQQVLDEHPDFEGGPDERFAVRPMTRFERRGVAAGRPITDLTYRRC
ncbi:tRNA (guanosine(46)-N7)-methyltransferase TrmB [Arsenicicoccus dermatophilus]|uniref:tRNA (guanosine(46)-N7)-methyltransferase TrmB n=1 Tax=Arsenicicoccus dermatophilus TaxID=1076331 RepID=UPI00391706D5